MTGGGVAVLLAEEVGIPAAAVKVRVGCVEVARRRLDVAAAVARPGDAGDPGAAEEHRYPFSGATNPSVKLGVVGVSGGDVAWLDLTKAGLGEDTYLARVYWASDDTVLACVQSRDQRTMRLVAYDIDKGTDRVVLEETNKAWLNLNDCLRWGIVEGEGLIASERDGVQHLYVHSTGDGKVVRRLTEGTDCVVEELVDVLVRDVEEAEHVNARPGLTQQFSYAALGVEDLLKTRRSVKCFVSPCLSVSDRIDRTLVSCSV